jgi:uncharacterized membrane protein YkvA (DUF1232 family)
MIKRFIDNIKQDIEAIDEKLARESLIRVTLLNNRSYCENLASRMSEQNVDKVLISPELVAQGIFVLQMAALKVLPYLCARIYDVVNSNLCAPVHKISLASVLIYLAQPNDIIPDDTKNGIGYLDDALIAFTVSKEYINLLYPDEDQEKLITNIEAYCNALTLALPKTLYDRINKRIKEIWDSYHKLKHADPYMVEMIFQQTLNDPNTLIQFININLNKVQDIPEAPKIQSHSRFPKNQYYDEQSGSLHISFPMGGGAISTSDSIVIWD